MSRPVQTVTDDELEALVELARSEARTRFPNPHRIACPAAVLLRASARGGSLPGASALHITSCSPCYGEYTRFQREARRRRLGLLGLAAAAALLVGVYVGWVHAPAQQVAEKREQPRPSPPIARIVAKPPVQVTVNLAQFAVVRGDDSKAVRPARLPAKRLRVTFLMPLGVDAGIYRVSLAQQASPVVEEKTVRAQLRDGIAFFELEFEAEVLAGKRITLAVQPNGQSWRRYPLLIDGSPREGAAKDVDKKK